MSRSLTYTKAVDSKPSLLLMRKKVISLVSVEERRLRRHWDVSSPGSAVVQSVASSKGDRARQAHERRVLQQVLACGSSPRLQSSSHSPSSGELRSSWSCLRKSTACGSWTFVHLAERDRQQPGPGPLSRSRRRSKDSREPPSRDGERMPWTKACKQTLLLHVI